MPTLPQVESHARQLRALTSLATKALEVRFRRLDLDDLAGMQRTLTAYLPTLVDQFGSAAAAGAADWYDDLRADSPARGRFRAVPANLPGESRTAALAGWATSTTDRPLVLERLAGGVQRIVANADRDTITESARRDPHTVRYARHASANACAFCAMVASRGAVYRSEASAGEGRKYHDKCHCIAVPVWDGGSYQPAPYVKAWESAYKNAGTSDTSAALAAMRESLDTN